MYLQEYQNYLREQIKSLKESGLYKEEREIISPQQSHIQIVGGRTVLNFCANNYLGLANHPDIIASAKSSYDEYGFGLASVRFICGTQSIHHVLEKSLSEFLQTEDTILYSSCFDANGGLFETLMGENDAIISDTLNHASIIDGIRLSKARRLRYKNNDMIDLENQLKSCSDSRYRLIATDGVFSMDGVTANLRDICNLAERYQALVMVDDSHAVGIMGARGSGTAEYHDVIERVDIVTGTLGKALGGASGGYTSGRKEIIEWLRQRSRPYLFSNALAPSMAAASITALDLLKSSSALRQRLHENSRYFRQSMSTLGFKMIPGEHPIIPIMLNEASLAKKFAEEMLKRDIYVISFSYPVVPQGQARIRVQMSAAHSLEDINRALAAFEQVGKLLSVTPSQGD